MLSKVSTFVWKAKKAISGCEEHVMEFVEFNAALPTHLTKMWMTQCQDWEKDQLKPNSFKTSKTCTTSLAMSYFTDTFSIISQLSLTMKYVSRWQRRTQKHYWKRRLPRFTMMCHLACSFLTAWKLRNFSMFEQSFSESIADIFSVDGNWWLIQQILALNPQISRNQKYLNMQILFKEE